MIEYKEFNLKDAIDFLRGDIAFMSESEVRQFQRDLANYLEITMKERLISEEYIRNLRKNKNGKEKSVKHGGVV